MMARVKSLLRLKMVTDQLLSHTGQSISSSRILLQNIEQQKGRILLVDDHPRNAEKIADTLREKHHVVLESDPVAALRLARSNIDMAIVSLLSENFDGLRICASLKFDKESRDIPILVVGDPEDESRFVRAYDCLLYTSPSPRDRTRSRMPSSA